MKRISFVLAGVFIFAPFYAQGIAVPYAPHPNATSQAPVAPLYIYIPSIKLHSPIQGVGTDEKGRMDVPSGKTNNVGWYQYGPVPGHTGTAVLDAHVTAAFKNLSKVPVGAEIFIYTSKGRWQKFVVSEAKVYEATVSPKVLFEDTKNRQINLITCAGKLLGGGEATHRLIVSAKLAV